MLKVSNLSVTSSRHGWNRKLSISLIVSKRNTFLVLMIRLQFFHAGALHLLILSSNSRQRVSKSFLHFLITSKLSAMHSQVPFGILSFLQLSFQTENISTTSNEVSVGQTVVSSTFCEYALQSLTVSPLPWLLDLDSLRNSPAKYSSCKKHLYVLVFNHWQSWINDNLFKQCGLSQNIGIWSDWYPPRWITTDTFHVSF